MDGKLSLLFISFLKQNNLFSSLYDTLSTEQKFCVDLLSQDIQKIDEMDVDLQLDSNIESYLDSVDGPTTPKIRADVVNTNSNSGAMLHDQGSSNLNQSFTNSVTDSVITNENPNQSFTNSVNDLFCTYSHPQTMLHEQ